MEEKLVIFPLTRRQSVCTAFSKSFTHSKFIKENKETM